MKYRYFLHVAIWLCLSYSFHAHAQLPVDVNVVTYNLLNFPNPSNNDTDGNDAARAVDFRLIIESVDADVILLQELKTLSGITILLNELNSNSSLGKTYAGSTVYTGYGTPPDLLGNGLIYNTAKVNLLAEIEIAPTTTAVANDGTIQVSPRGVSRYEMEAISPDCNLARQSFTCLTLHLKASNDNADNNEVSDRDRRNLGITDLLNDVNALPATENIIVGGDFNFYADHNNGGTYYEPGYVAMLNNSNHPFVDVLGGWTRNTSSQVSKYTQSTRTDQNEYGNGGVPGGLDDRFDLIFINQTLNNSNSNMSYLPGSYAVVQNANVFNGNALDGNEPLEDEVHSMSDHYPVLMRFNVQFDVDPACLDCTGSPAQINNLPSIVFDATPISISVSPAGGILSGNGIIFNAFNPAVAGQGLHTIQYTYTDTDGCEYMTTQDVLVGSINYNFVNYNLGTINPRVK